jgi:hypothetical protein
LSAADETQLYDLMASSGYEVVLEFGDVMPGAKDETTPPRSAISCWAGFHSVAKSVRHFLEALDELNHLGIESVSFPENVHLTDHRGPTSRGLVGDRAYALVDSSD